MIMSDTVNQQNSQFITGIDNNGYPTVAHLENNGVTVHTAHETVDGIRFTTSAATIEDSQVAASLGEEIHGTISKTVTG